MQKVFVILGLRTTGVRLNLSHAFGQLSNSKFIELKLISINTIKQKLF